MVNLDDILIKSVEIIKKTGVFIKNQQKNVTKDIVETKSLHDFVTFVDKESEKFLVDNLSALIPDAGFITEEKTTTKYSENYNWIIDPLDGTTNYIHGLFPVCVSVALQYQKETVLGVVYEIGLDECFWAVKDKGAFLNGYKIKVSDTDKVENTLIATGFPYYDYKHLPQFMQTIEYFMQHSHGLRRLGSAAADLAYVACGRCDAFYEYSLKAWDVAAGAFIIQEAGGKVSDFSGEKNYLFGQEIVTSNSLVFNEFLSIIKRIIK